jgi:hypothetical protein
MRLKTFDVLSTAKYPNDLNSLTAPAKENDVIANVGRPNAWPQFWPIVTYFRILADQLTLTSELRGPRSRGIRLVPRNESRNLLQVVFRNDGVPKNRHELLPLSR